MGNDIIYITGNFDQYPIKKISSNKNEKLKLNSFKIPCLDCMLGVLALICSYFCNKKVPAERKIQYFLRFCKKSSRKC